MNIGVEFIAVIDIRAVEGLGRSTRPEAVSQCAVAVAQRKGAPLRPAAIAFRPVDRQKMMDQNVAWFGRDILDTIGVRISIDVRHFDASASGHWCLAGENVWLEHLPPQMGARHIAQSAGAGRHRIERNPEDAAARV